MAELIVAQVFTTDVIVRNQRGNIRLRSLKMQHDTNLSASSTLAEQASTSKVDVGNAFSRCCSGVVAAGCFPRGRADSMWCSLAIVHYGSLLASAMKTRLSRVNACL